MAGVGYVVGLFLSERKADRWSMGCDVRIIGPGKRADDDRAARDGPGSDEQSAVQAATRASALAQPWGIKTVDNDFRCVHGSERVL